MLLHKKYGDMFETHLAGQRLIYLCNPELIENMNVPSITKTKYPNRRIIVPEGLKEYGVSSTGIVNNLDINSWKYNRNFLTQAMMTPSFNHQAVEWTNEIWSELEYYWNKLGENRELNLMKWMHGFTNDMIFIIATGKRNNSAAARYYHLVPESNNLTEKEKEKIKESEKFIRSLETLIRGAIFFFFFNGFMRRYVPFIRGKAKSLLKNRDYLYERIYKIIKERRIEIENTPLDQPLGHDTLTSYITANTPRDTNTMRLGNVNADSLRPMTDKEILGNILDTMAGGTDTVSNLICYIVYHLGRHPEVVRRLRQEFDEVLGKDVTKPVTYNDIDKLQYCDAVIKEVYRHVPVIYTLPRANNERDTVGGYSWPEKTAFSMLYFVMMKRKDYWTDPEKFDPDRFYKIDESDKYLLEKRYAKTAFSLFGGGIRICPGKKLAMIELKCLLALIYRKYDIELADPNAPLNYITGLLIACKELHVKVKPRKF